MDYLAALEKNNQGLEWILDLPKDAQYIPIEIDISLLLQVVPELAQALFRYPGDVLEIGKDAVRDHIKEIAGNLGPILNRYILLRPYNLPKKTTISQLSVHDIDKLVSFTATVSIRGKPTRQLMVSHDKCHQCGFEIRTPARDGIISGPFECEKSLGGCGKKFPGNTYFIHDPEKSDYIDFLKLELEDIHTAELPGQAEKIEAWIHGELAADPMKRPEAGAHIQITGIFISHRKLIKSGFREAEGKDVIKILNITQEEHQDLEVSDEDQARYVEIKDKAFDHIVKSIAPRIHGYKDVKEGLALYLFGGAPQEGCTGEVEESPISVLVVGDPSTGKTKIIDGACLLAPKSFKASGKGATGKGLVAAIATDGLSKHGEKVLKAGVLAKADKGHARIDELDKLHEEDQDHLREAMSEGKVPINKAGISATIHTRAAIAAAANPPLEILDPNIEPHLQNPLSPAIRSRFALIYYVRKDPNPTSVKVILEQMVRTRKAGDQLGLDWPFFNTPQEKVHDIRKYISWARRHDDIVWMDDANEILITRANDLIWHYNEDLRAMEGLLRLSEAAARARLSDKVEVKDVSMAIEIFECSLKSGLQAITAVPEEVRSGSVEKTIYGRIEA